MASSSVTEAGKTSSTASSSGAAKKKPSTSDSNEALRGLNMDQFLKLMITELQNQDPLNPMENADILQQLNQIRSIGATDKLTSTLDSVLLGQTLANASGLVGKEILALGKDGKDVRGMVEGVSIVDNQPMMRIKGQLIGLANIREIVPPAEEQTTSDDEEPLPEAEPTS